MNRISLMIMVAALMHLSMASQDSLEIKEVRRALSHKDAIACSGALTPIVEKLAKEGYFSNGQCRNEIVYEILRNSLDRRVAMCDDQWRNRFNAIEFMMRQSSVLRLQTFDEELGSRIKQYFRDVKRSPVGALKLVIDAARKKDEALIAAGKIEYPPITTGWPTTPNLMAVREEVDKVNHWNDLVSGHRLRVGRLLASVLKQNVDNLPEDMRLKWWRDFIEEADLSQDEINIMVKDQKIREQLTVGGKTKDGDQQYRHKIRQDRSN